MTPARGGVVRQRRRAATAPQNRTGLRACLLAVTLSNENALSRSRHLPDPYPPACGPQWAALGPLPRPWSRGLFTVGTGRRSPSRSAAAGPGQPCARAERPATCFPRSIRAATPHYESARATTHQPPWCVETPCYAWLCSGCRRGDPLDGMQAVRRSRLGSHKRRVGETEGWPWSVDRDRRPGWVSGRLTVEDAGEHHG